MINKFLFFDFETFGLNTMRSKSSQFGAIMTDADLNIIQPDIEYYSYPVYSSLPEIPACLITGITPLGIMSKQKEGDSSVLREYYFFKKLEELFKNNTNMCAVGYNNYNYDDEIIRHGFYRNLIAPYDREYKNNNTKFDIIHFTRVFAFLYPEDIKIPLNEDGYPSFKLGDLAKANDLVLTRAHDALSDVYTTIALAKFMKEKHEDFWEYALLNKDKNSISNFLTNNKEFFLYSTYFSYKNKYFSYVHHFDNIKNPDNPQENYVLRMESVENIKKMLELDPEFAYSQLFARNEKKEIDFDIPVHSFKINGAPFMFTPKHLNNKNIKPTVDLRSEFDLNAVMESKQFIAENEERIISFIKKMLSFKPDFKNSEDVDQLLYSGFLNNKDNKAIEQFHIDMNNQHFEPYFLSKPFIDDRLNELSKRIILRNFCYSLKDKPEYIQQEYAQLLHKHLGASYEEGVPDSQRASNITLKEFEKQINEYLQKPDYQNNEIILSLKKYYESIQKHYDTISEKYPMSDNLQKKTFKL